MRNWGKLRAYRDGLTPWSQRLAAVALVGPACILVALFWLQERPEPLTVTALLIGGILWPATILLAVSVVAILAGPWPFARTGSLLAGGLSIALGLATGLAIRQPVDYLGVTFAVLTMLAGAGLIYLVARAKVTSWELRLPRVAVLLTGILALLPIVQFWHTTSFLPSRLSTNLGATVTTDAVPMPNGAQGVIKVSITNSGDIGARIVASDLIVCYRTSPRDAQPLVGLNEDRACVNDRIFENLAVVDARSTWPIQIALRRPEKPPAQARLMEATVHLWYARQDRLNVGDEIDLAHEADVSRCSSQHRENEVLTGYKVLDQSRPQSVVQRSRRLVYLRQDNGIEYFAFQAQGEDVCDATEHPKESQYRIGESVGLNELRLNYEAWLTQK